MFAVRMTFVHLGISDLIGTASSCGFVDAGSKLDDSHFRHLDGSGHLLMEQRHDIFTMSGGSENADPGIALHLRVACLCRKLKRARIDGEVHQEWTGVEPTWTNGRSPQSPAGTKRVPPSWPCSPSPHVGKYQEWVVVVGATGIEPVTPWMSTKCSTAELRALMPLECHVLPAPVGRGKRSNILPPPHFHTAKPMPQPVPASER